MQTEGYSQILSLFAEDEVNKFNLLRLKLVRFFELQGVLNYSEDLADETISRVAEKLSEGVKIEIAEPFYYFRGVAMNVLREHWRKTSKTILLEDTENTDFSSKQTNPHDIEEENEKRNLKERQLDCLNKSLNVLPSESRELFLDYHREGNVLRETFRSEIAKKLNIDVTALRNRVTRLRKKLEKMVLDCLKNN
jgi:RNA polymerase sigma factor (sigma-70 family)